MKYLVLTLALTFATLFTYARHEEKLVIKTNISCSHCLQCGSCGESINKHIKEQYGITSVEIDPKANTITVVYNVHETTADEIRMAINKAGYDADDKKASAEQVKKLDACCKKKK